MAAHEPGAVRPALDPLESALSASNDRTRRTAARALVALVRADERDGAAAAFDRVLSALPARLDDGDEPVRRGACYVLGVLRDGDAREAVASLADAADLELAAVATAALRRIDGDGEGGGDPPCPSGEVFLERRSGGS